MRRLSFLSLLAFAVGLLLPAVITAPAHAQARLWVSASVYGDDTKDCSRPNPCASIQHVINVAPAGSEINCLDPGGFGGFTVNKALTINCDGVIAGTLYVANTGVTVSAGANDAVYLSGLTINGSGTGNFGVKFISGKSLTIENTKILNNGAANGLGIAFNPTGASFLTIINTTISGNGDGSSGGGIQLAPAASGFGLVQMDRVRITGNYIGIGGGGSATVNAMISGSTISNNRNIGVSVSGGASVTLYGSTVAGNGAAATSGNVFSFGNNGIKNNSPDTTPSIVSLR